MLYNEKEKRHLIFLNGDNYITGDGLDVRQNYELNYKFLKSGFSRNLISIKGIDLVGSTGRVLNTWYGEVGNLGEIRRELQQFVVLYGTGLLDKPLFRKIKKEYHRDVVEIVKGGLKGKGKYYPILMDCISTYLYLTCVMDKENSMSNNSMTIVDTVGSESSVEDREYYSKKGEGYWKNQNVTKRLGIKSLDEFMKGFSGGVLSYEWGSIS